MDRKRWATAFKLADAGSAPWPCPECGQAALTVAPGTIQLKEGRASREAHDHEAWEPEWIDERFTCMLVCSCGEWIALVGRQTVEAFFAGTLDDPRLDYSPLAEPLYFYPSLRVIPIPTAVPSDVRHQLEHSFAVLWADVEACANRVRTSVEKLLDYRGVRRTAVNKKNKRVTLTLHSRIELFGKSGQPHAEELMAVKWLGNAGSHSLQITREDLFDAYDIMEHVLGEMFDPPAKRIASLAKQINRAKKPRSAARSVRRRRTR